MKTLNITDFKSINSKLAKVIVSHTGDIDKNEFHDLLCTKLKFGAAPIEASFRQVKAGVSVGFVRKNVAVRPVTRGELRANYRLLSSGANILMDNEDKTLWEVKEGAGGQYLARHGNEDLSELLTASTYRGRPDVPKVHQLSIGKGAISELAAFVHNDKIDYGFIVKTSSDKCQVLSASTKATVDVPNELVAGFYAVDLPKEVHAKTAKQLQANIGPEAKAKAIDYWRTLYSYNPAYMEKVIQQVEKGVVA